MEYIEGKLEQENQWEILSYKIGGKRIRPGGVTLLEVKWPNGETESIPSRVVNEVVKVHDMGHSYSQPRTKLVGVINYKGFEVEVAADRLEVVGVTVGRLGVVN